MIGERDLNAGAVAKLINAFRGWGYGLDTTELATGRSGCAEMSVHAVRELLEEMEAYVDDSDIYKDIVFPPINRE